MSARDELRRAVESLRLGLPATTSEVDVLREAERKLALEAVDAMLEPGLVSAARRLAQASRLAGQAYRRAVRAAEGEDLEDVEA